MPKAIKVSLLALSFITVFVAGMWYEMTIVADLLTKCSK